MPIETTFKQVKIFYCTVSYTENFSLVSFLRRLLWTLIRTAVSRIEHLLERRTMMQARADWLDGLHL
jgi:hypothetical protein